MSLQTVPADTGAPARAEIGPGKEGGEGRAGWGLAAPFLILYLLFIIGPTVYGIVMSFFNSSLEHNGLGGFAGPDNYTQALTSADFWQSMWHTVLFTLMTTPPLVVLAMMLAIFADRLKRGRWFLRLVFLAPYVVPSAAMALIWTWLYTPQIGLWDKWLCDFPVFEFLLIADVPVRRHYEVEPLRFRSLQQFAVFQRFPAEFGGSGHDVLREKARQRTRRILVEKDLQRFNAG
jgi:ABC-type sugar transport system permease subunit